MMENMNQKVYINPNFNRTGTYLNKHFCHVSSNTVQQNNRKIFVNPNFIPMKESHSANFQQLPPKPPDYIPSVNIFYNKTNDNFTPLVVSKPNNTDGFVTSTFTTSHVCKNQNIGEVKSFNGASYDQNNLQYQRIDSRKNYNKPFMKNSKYRLVRNTNLVKIPVKSEVREENLKPEMSSTGNIFFKMNTVPEKKSRYCIVRNNTNIIQCNNTSITCKSIVKSNTIKVGKYKTTTLNNLKKELTVKDIKNKIPYEPKLRNLLVNNKSFNSPLLKVSLKQNKYKYKNVNINRKSTNTDIKDIKLNSSVNRSILYKKTKNKILIKKYKINNIPCALYVKYGKCLRKSNGICEYLHDKKHVSLCRKFIKGICHDTNCLLSHELSTNKMPTCYFYLKGMCTKENCPYLHVKLSSNTRICQDFLKGYCEKGEKCSERHIYQTSPLKVKRLRKKNLDKMSPKVQKILNKSRSKKPKQKEDNINLQHRESDQRYFKDTLNENEKCEKIKPLRCKLGALPSYIQLL